MAKKNSKGLELLRFLVCGCAAALTDYLFAQLTVWVFGLCGISSQEHWVLVTIISTAIGFVFGVVVNYLLSTFWVYQNVDKSIQTKSKKFIFWFTVLSLCAMALSIGAMLLCNVVVEYGMGQENIVKLSIIGLIKEHGIGFLSQAIFWSYFISFCIKTIVGLIWNYFTRKYILYKEPRVTFADQVNGLDVTIKKLSIVIPCYNEEQDIKAKVEFTQNYLKDFPIEYEIICVNDGSKDNTMEVISHLDGIKGIGYTPNRGKGGAVRFGIENATGDYVVFMDADLSTDLSALTNMLPLCGKYDFIMGSRHHKESQIPIKQPFKRQFIGRCCRILVNMRFHFHSTDTQCGFKCIRTDLAKKMVAKQTINGFAFDVEYLYIAKINNMSVIEIPIIWKDDRGSTVSPLKSSIAFFKDMGKIKKNKKNYKFED